MQVAPPTSLFGTATEAQLSQAAVARQETEIQRQIDDLSANAAPGTQADVDITYTTTSDGQLVAQSARVTTQQVDEQAANNPNALPQDVISLSPEAQAIQREQESANGLTAEEQAVVAELELIDGLVRQEEAIHFRTLGSLAGNNPDLQYTQGPDGKFYATAGSVSVGGSSSTDPEQVARDAAVIANAALAPGTASAQDIAVARSSISQSAGASAQAAIAATENARATAEAADEDGTNPNIGFDFEA